MRVIFSIFASLLISSVSHAGFGIHFASGAPYLSQIGINYQMSNTIGFSITQNTLSLDSGLSKVSLTMPEIMFNYHPWAGAFFIGLGFGQETLAIEATETLGSNVVNVDVSAMTTILKLGWMWGAGDGGFWFGLDYSYIAPSGADPEITANGVSTTDQAYIDALDAAQKFGDTAYGNFTFFRLGYLF